jgi:hypothetical protein
MDLTALDNFACHFRCASPWIFAPLGWRVIGVIRGRKPWAPPGGWDLASWGCRCSHIPLHTRFWTRSLFPEGQKSQIRDLWPLINSTSSVLKEKIIICQYLNIWFDIKMQICVFSCEIRSSGNTEPRLQLVKAVYRISKKPCPSAAGGLTRGRGSKFTTYVEARPSQIPQGRSGLIGLCSFA